ncbi:GAF domain [Plesiocystis pacifica SIR-1]|uniref:GAF domain n=2 Tax=Plesiocystis pacifica TaxID=191768 RepID=A6G6E5_9BACT|nr:GAF domain [Plesiocystis pacifica SIR-1]
MEVMHLPARPAHEAARLAALRQYAIVDTEPEPRYDEIARIVARAFDVPMAFISLINEDRHWTKAGIGYSGSIARDITFCTHAIEADEVLLVPDATQDERFAANPLVEPEGGVRFYAGAPLVVPGGHRLGTVCAVDVRPRTPKRELLVLLGALARQVVELLELRRRSKRLAESVENARTLGELIPICAQCRKVRRDDAFWSSLEGYMSDRAGTRFARGRCSECKPPASPSPSLGSAELSQLPEDFDELPEVSAEENSATAAIEAALRDLSLPEAELGEALTILDAQRREIDELHRVSAELSELLAGIRTLGELIPLCVDCGKVRQDNHYWSSLEDFVEARAGSRFSHGICPSCLRELYPDLADAVLSKQG